MQDPNARNCHGYRKFVKRTILEDPTKGFLANDTIIIKYTIELVVSTGERTSHCAHLFDLRVMHRHASRYKQPLQPLPFSLVCKPLLSPTGNHRSSFLPLPAGGALSRGGGGSKSDMVKVPPPSMGAEMGQLLASGNGTDYTFIVEGEEMKVKGAAVGSRPSAAVR